VLSIHRGKKRRGREEGREGGGQERREGRRKEGKKEVRKEGRILNPIPELRKNFSFSKMPGDFRAEQNVRLAELRGG
jgi:hypothetical protein